MYARRDKYRLEIGHVDQLAAAFAHGQTWSASLLQLSLLRPLGKGFRGRGSYGQLHERRSRKGRRAVRSGLFAPWGRALRPMVFQDMFRTIQSLDSLFHIIGHEPSRMEIHPGDRDETKN